MAEKLKDTAIYKAYLALGTRPQNSPTFSRDAKGNIILVSGEVYCRAAMPDGSICKVKSKYSTTGNLRTHVKSHKVTLAGVRAGTTSMMENEENISFYNNLMACHKAAATAPQAGSSVPNNFPAIATPQKLPNRKEKVHRPILPRKKDGSIHKGKAKKISGIIANRCEECKVTKKSCPDLDNFKCEVRNYFTDDLDEELKEGEADEQDQDLESE